MKTPPGFVGRRGRKKGAWRGAPLVALLGSAASSLDNAESGDVLKVADIAGSDTEAELQSGSCDQEILEGDAHSLFGLFAPDAAGELGRLSRHRMHRPLAGGFVDEP